MWSTADALTGSLSVHPGLLYELGIIVAGMLGLGYAMRDLPVGTAYAVWVGIGAVLTVGYAMATGEEAVSVVRILLVLGVVGCVIGLKLTH